MEVLMHYGYRPAIAIWIAVACCLPFCGSLTTAGLLGAFLLIWPFAWLSTIILMVAPFILAWELTQAIARSMTGLSFRRPPGA